MVKAGNYNYNHNITITYKTIGAENLGKASAMISTNSKKAETDTAKLNNTLTKTQSVAKSTSGSLDLQKNAVLGLDKTTLAYEQSVKKADATTEGFGNKMRSNRGLIFGFTGLTASIAEAQGMLSMFGDALEKKNELQAEVNRLEAEGKQGTKEYADAQSELNQATRAYGVFQRNTILSLFDLITFTTMIAMSLLPRMNKETLTSIGRILTLGRAFKSTAAVTTASNGAIAISSGLIAGMPPKIDATTASVSRFGKVSAMISMTNPFFIAIVALGAILAAVAFNVGGLRDRMNELGKTIGDAVPFLRPLLDMLGQLGGVLASFTGQEASAFDKTTDALGHITPEAEKANQAIIATRNALEAMFNVDYHEAERIKKSIEDIIGTLEVAKPEGILEKIGKFFDFWSTAHFTLEDGKEQAVEWWKENGIKIMGSEVYSKSADTARRELASAMNFLMTAGPEEIEEAIDMVKKAIKKYYDELNSDIEDKKSKVPLLVTEQDYLKAFNAQYDVTQDQHKRLIEVFNAYVTLRESGEKNHQQALIEIAKTSGGVLTEQDELVLSKMIENYETSMTEIEALAVQAADHRTKLTAETEERSSKIINEYSQRRLRGEEVSIDQLLALAELTGGKFEEIDRKVIEARLDLVKVYYDTLDETEKKAFEEQLKNREEYNKIILKLEEEQLETETANSDAYIKLLAEKSKNMKEYQDNIKTLTDENEFMSLSAERQAVVVDLLWQKWGALLDLSKEDIFEHLTKGAEDLTETLEDQLKIIDMHKTYEEHLKTLAPTIDTVNGSSLSYKGTIQGLIDKYPELKLTGDQVWSDLTAANKDATKEIKGYSDAFLEAVKIAEDAGAKMHDAFKGVVMEELFDQGDDKGLDKKLKKDINRLSKRLMLSKDETRKIVVGFQIEAMISNPDEAVNSINEAITYLSENAKAKPEDLKMLSDDYWEEFRKAFKTSGGTGIESKDTAILAAINEAIKVDWDDLSPEEAIQKLKEIKQKLIDAGFIDPEDQEKTEDPIGIKKIIENSDLEEVTKKAIEEPIGNAVASTAEMFAEMSNVFGKTAIAMTKIGVAWHNGLIKLGDNIEKQLEDNFANIQTAVSDTSDEVDDLQDALDSLPKKVSIEIEITKTGNGARVGGIVGDLGARSGGVLGIPTLGLAQGGFIANQAMVYRGARIAEFNKPEAVIPLSNPDNFADRSINLNTRPNYFHLMILGNDIVRSSDVFTSISPSMGRYMSRYGKV